jgi:hypothetical protein
VLVRLCFQRFALVAVITVAIVLIGRPSCAQAMVGDVPGMPSMESGGSDPGGGPGGSSGGGGGGSGSPPPSSTPEPTTLLSGLMGFGLVGAFVAKKRGVGFAV